MPILFGAKGPGNNLQELEKIAVKLNNGTPVTY